MVTWSSFVDHAVNLRGRIPARAYEAIISEAKARLRDRQAAGYGATPLDFRDLSERLENACQPH